MTKALLSLVRLDVGERKDWKSEIGNRVAKKEALLENNVIYVLMNA